MIATPRACLVAVVTLLFAASAGLGKAEQKGQAPLLDRVDERLSAKRDELIAVRQDLHQHPELSGQEVRTARVVAERLRRLGLEVRTGVGGHGVVAILTGAAPGPRIAVRADMDAVRSEAPDPVVFRSRTPGVRHICGHDIHTTVVLALAEGLATIREALAGSVVLVFQPAEETATGARAMIADGALEGLRPDAFLSLHTAPLEVGQIGSRPGRLLAGRDLATVTLRAEHDLEASARAITEAIGQLSTISQAEAVRSTTGPFVLANVVRDTASSDTASGEAGERTIAAMITTSDDRRASVRATLEAAVEKLQQQGVDAQLRYDAEWMAGAWNDPALEARVRKTVRNTLGENALVPLSGVIPMFSEDFGAFLEDTPEDIPGVMLFLGVSNAEKGWVGMPHSSAYVADEEAIFIGARTLAAIVLDSLGAH